MKRVLMGVVFVGLVVVAVRRVVAS